MSIRIVLADPHWLYRRVISDVLGAVADLVVVAEARDGHDAVLVAKLTRPDLVILDVAMPRLDGIQACRSILAADGRTRVLALTLHNDSCYLQAMAQAGALGYVLKQDAFTDLVAAVRAVMGGYSYLSSSLAAANGRVSSLPRS